MRVAYSLIFLSSILMVTGCQQERASWRMVNYVKTVEARPPGKVEPIPESPVYKAYAYKDTGLRSPFSAPVHTNKDRSGLSQNGPDLDRAREPLERFPLDALLMVGTLSKEGKMWAIIKDKEGSVHRVTDGNYIGQNYGKIISITNDRIIILEKIPDEGEAWKDHPAVLKMHEE